MSETSCVDVDGEREGEQLDGAVDPNANGKVASLRIRTQRLAVRLQQAHKDMEEGAHSPSAVTASTAAAASFMRIYVPLPQGRPVVMPMAPTAPAPARASSMPVANMPMPMPYNMQQYYYTMQHPPPPPAQMQLQYPAQPPLALPPATHPTNVIDSSVVPKKNKKSKRALNHEVDALKQLVQTLSSVSPDVNAYAHHLIRQSEVLSQLEWLKPNPRMALPVHPLQQQMGAARPRHESEMSSTSSSSAPQPQPQQQLQQQQQPTPSGRKRNRQKRDSAKQNVPHSLKTELEAMRSYINKIVQYHVGTDQQLPPELIFKGDFSDLEAHAQRLVKAGYGRIVEDEIRINRKNNRQSFITMSTDREALERDGIVLLPVARRYAFEGDTVRAFVLNMGAAQSKTGEQTEGGITGGKPSISLAEDEELSDETESADSDADPDNTVVISSDNCPKAFVIAITKQTELRQIVGTISFTNPNRLCDDNKFFYKFRPYDLRIPMVYIPQEACAPHMGNGKKQPEDVCGLLYLAHILETDCNGHCIADLIQPVGHVGNLEDEIKAILFHNNLRDVKPFEQRFNDLYAEPALPISSADLLNRRDLRKSCIFTIDPLTARDLDDAMSIEQISKNEFEVGVHISDVSHYLMEDSELDNIVKERSTSIYLVNEVIHMLPQTLCFRCSLLPGEDKFAFSVFWRLDGQGRPLRKEPEFTRSIINSCTQFAYEHAQKIIDNPRERFTEHDFPTILNGFQVNDVVKRVQWLHGIASAMRQKRFDQGALTINNAKLRFVLDPLNGEPQGFEVEKQREANRMIEEFMLLANQAVARFIHDKFPDIAVLRNHPPPLVKSLKALREKLQALGFELDYSSSKALQESMVRLCQEAPNPIAMNACLSQLLMKPMARANYFCSEGKTEPGDLWHYALSIPIYTHFTSPIRRYPDVMVHRLLAAGLSYGPPPARTPDELHALTKLANERKYNAKSAGDDSSNLYFKRYVRNRQGVYMHAVVMEIFQHMMNVVTLESGHVISINYKMQKVFVDTHNAPNSILIAERSQNQPPTKLQLLSVVPIRLIIWDNKLTGFLLTSEQRQRLKEPQQPQPQPSGSTSRRHKPPQQTNNNNNNTANNSSYTQSGQRQRQQQQQQQQQQQRLRQQQQQQQRMYAMRQNSL